MFFYFSVMERYFKRKTQPEILEPSPKSPKNNESSSKQICVDSMKVNLETLQYIMDCIDQFRVIILMFETKFEEPISKINLVNQKPIHFPTQILGQSLEGSILLGLLSFLIGWSIAHHRMLPIVYVVISSNLILEINLVGILLLESDSRIGSARRN